MTRDEYLGLWALWVIHNYLYAMGYDPMDREFWAELGY